VGDEGFGVDMVRPTTTNRRGDPLLVLLMMAAAVVPPLFGLFGTGITGRPTMIVFWFVVTVIHVSNAVLSCRVARLHRADEPQIRARRRLWWFLTATATVWAFGQLHQFVELFADPHGHRADLDANLHLINMFIGLVLALIGMLRFPSGGNRSGLRMDVATVMAAAATASLLIVQLPPGQRGATWVFSLLIALLIQPGMFLLLVFAVVRLVLSGRSPFTRTGGLIYGLAAVLQTVLQAIPQQAYAGPRESCWMLGALVFASSLLAVAAGAHHGHVQAAPAQGRERPARSYSRLPYGAMGVSWLISSAMLPAYGLTWRTWLVIVGTGVTTMLVVARQVAAFQRVAQLLAERDELAARLTELAFHDGLTGLANRALFLRTLADSLSRSPVTVFLIDLDDFKPVNDNFGHATGDRLLIEVGRRLRACVRPGDTVARLGGDEFAVLMDGLDPDRREAMAAELSAALSGPTRLDEIEVAVRASVGVATGHPDRHDPDSLLHEADMAMYAVKNAARAVRR
jgi:diguanylate cyclase (GGDEF)-like protein